MMQKFGITGSVSYWVKAVLVVQAVAALWIGLPGQMSTDSIIQLYEGHSHQTISFNPPLLSILLGVMDRLGSGPIGFVLFSMALLSGATWLVLAPAPACTNWRCGLAALCVLNPVLLAYVGIVWKDVLFAHAVVLLFLLLALWKEREVRLGLMQMVLLVGLMTLAVGVRQQGVLFATLAAVWIAAMTRYSRVGKVLLAFMLALIPVVINQTLGELVQRPLEDPVNGSAVGFKILMHYDLVGMMVHQGQLADGTAKEVVDEVRNLVPLYSPYRVDTLTGPTAHLWSISVQDTFRLWGRSIVEDPAAYLGHRWVHAMTFLGMAETRKCAPFYSGIAGPLVHPLAPNELTAAVGLTPGLNHASRFVNGAGWELAHTPLLMHWVYVVVLLGVCAVLLRYRAYVLLSLAVCSLVYLASYFVLGIACDFRYGYALTVTTSLLTAWAVLKQSRATSPTL